MLVSEIQTRAIHLKHNELLRKLTRNLLLILLQTSRRITETSSLSILSLDLTGQDKIFHKFKLQKQICFMIGLVFAFSKFIGYGIVFSSSIVKVPQLVNIIRAKSTKGLAELVLYTETFGYMIGLFYPMHYGQPFSTYGESLFICIQAVIILCLLWHFNKKDYPPQRVFVLGGCYSLFALILYDGRLLNDTIWMLLFSVIPQLSNVT